MTSRNIENKVTVEEKIKINSQKLPMIVTQQRQTRKTSCIEHHKSKLMGLKNTSSCDDKIKRQKGETQILVEQVKLNFAIHVEHAELKYNEIIKRACNPPKSAL